MGALIAAVAAAIPNAMIAIGAKLLTEAFFQKILEKILLQGLGYAAAMTTNTVDDSLVEEIRKRLEVKPNA